ncbi:MAG TPA: hypothetical protein VIF60_15365 [Burkholderiaceae bacterium]
MRKQSVSNTFCKILAVVAMLLTANSQVYASPVRLLCSFDHGANGGARVWIYDPDTHTVDGHRMGEKVTTVGDAYNQYFITDDVIGFSTSTGVRHTISRADGRYTAYSKDGKPIWSGNCVPTK